MQRWKLHLDVAVLVTDAQEAEAYSKAYKCGSETHPNRVIIFDVTEERADAVRHNTSTLAACSDALVQFVRRLQQLPHLSGVKMMKLAYLTGGTADLEKNKGLGYHAVVTKPVKPSSLFNALLGLFSSATQADDDSFGGGHPQVTRQWSPVKILVRASCAHAHSIAFAAGTPTQPIHTRLCG